MAEQRQVLIVGAGPAGAALGYLLASRGLEVTLLERQLDFAREFRGEILMPGGLEALEQLQLQGLDGVPQCRPTSAEGFSNGRSFFKQELDPELFGGRPPVAMSQPGLLEQIVAEAGRFPGFRFERGATVRELVREGDRFVGVRARTAQGELELRARLLVGTDGRSSVVRRRAGISPRRRPQVMDIVWCKFPLPESFGSQAPIRGYLGRGHLLIAYRSPDDRLQVAWAIQKGTFPELRSRGVEEWIKAMADHVSPDYAEHFRTHQDDVSRPFLLDAELDHVTSWTQPGLLLLGDAAHTMSPVGAQGLNVALRDAIVATNHLVPPFRMDAGNADVDAAARRVEEERLPEIDRVQRLQALPPRVVLNKARWADLVRNLVPAAARLSFVRSAAARAISLFAFGVSEVRLSV